MKTATIENDNHTNTWYVGPNFIMDNFTKETCNVSRYDKNIKLEYINIWTGLTVWDNPITRRPQLLQVNQELDMRHIPDHTLENPN